MKSCGYFAMRFSAVTPKVEQYCVAPETSRAIPAIGTVVAPTLLVTDGMSMATVPTGAVGVPPLVGKVIVVDAAGTPPAPVAIGVETARAFMDHGGHVLIVDRDEERLRNISTAAIAKVRQQASVGVMGDAFSDEAFCRAVVGAMQKPRELATAQGKLEFRPTAAFGRLAGKNYASLPAARPQGSSSNTVVVLGERLILKGYRRLRAGKSPELEMGLHLTDAVHYANCAAVAGVLEYRPKDGEPRLLAMLQKYVANQGEGWTYALEYLRRFLESCGAFGSISGASSRLYAESASVTRASAGARSARRVNTRSLASNSSIDAGFRFVRRFWLAAAFRAMRNSHE